MDTGKISVRYAKALYEYAAERKMEKKVYEEMKLLSEVFLLVPGFTKTLENPRILSEKKKELVLTAVGGVVSPEFRRFLDLVIERKRENFLLFISLKYLDFYRKENRIVIGKLTTAQPVQRSEEARIKKVVEEQNRSEVDFVTELNPNLIGGFVLQVGSYQLDASVSTQLKKIKDSLLQQNSVRN